MTRAEKDLLRGIENEGAVESALFSEVELFSQPRERNACHRLPRILSLFCFCDNFWDGSRLTGSILSCLREDAGPPSTIGSEIKLEIAGAIGSHDEEFGDVIFPEFGLILRGLAFGVREAWAARDFREKVKVSLIDPKKEANGVSEGSAGPSGGDRAAVGFEI